MAKEVAFVGTGSPAAARRGDDKNRPGGGGRTKETFVHFFPPGGFTPRGALVNLVTSGFSDA